MGRPATIIKFLTAITAIIAVNAVIATEAHCFLPIITNHIFADQADLADQPPLEIMLTHTCRGCRRLT